MEVILILSCFYCCFQIAINICLALLEKNLGLISLCLETQVGDQASSSLDLFKFISDIFISYGLALEHFR